jgi:sugar/nucleoside kinase (ribokinase family)
MTFRTLALGGISWNTMVYLEEFPEPRPQTVFAQRSHTTVGSSGAGKALNLHFLGADASLWATLGEDEAGDHARRYMADQGVPLYEALDPAGTARHVNLMDSKGDRISIFANSSSHNFTVDTDTVQPLVEEADLVSVTIFNPCRQFLPLLRKIGAPVWCDIHDYDGVNPYHEEFYTAADYLFMSSRAHPNWQDFLEERIAAGATVAVATHGPDGASGITTDEGWIHVPAVPVDEIVDTNGAGDGFFAGFAMAWLGGVGLGDALEAGATHASRVVASPDLAPMPRK